MAPVEKFIPAPIDDVWAVLADPRSYAFWVVGSHDIRKVEGSWPQVGATFEHVQGHGPVKLVDTTTVTRSEAPHRLELHVRIRPFLEGPVKLSLRELANGGTCLTIDEYVTGGAARLLPRLVTSPLIAMRNADAVRRLSAMAWARASALGHAPATDEPAHV